MPFCSNCGAEVAEDDKFCSVCGSPMVDETFRPSSSDIIIVTTPMVPGYRIKRSEGS